MLRSFQLNGRYRGFPTRPHTAILLDTDRLRAVHQWQDGYLEIHANRTESVWLTSIQFTTDDPESRLISVKQLATSVPIGQCAMIAGNFTTPQPFNYLIDAGWSCQYFADRTTYPRITPPPVDGDRIAQRCLTTGALTTVPGSVWYATTRPAAFGGAIAIGDWT